MRQSLSASVLQRLFVISSANISKIINIISVFPMIPCKPPDLYVVVALSKRPMGRLLVLLDGVDAGVLVL